MFLGFVFTLTNGHLSQSDVPDDHEDETAAPKRQKWYYLHHFVDWFCGLDASSVPGSADAIAAQKMATRLRDLQALKQNARSRALLYTALATLITLNIVIYVFFSTGSDFGLLRDSVQSIYRNVSANAGPGITQFRLSTSSINVTDFAKLT